MKRIFIGIKVTPDENFLRIFSSMKSEFSNESVKWMDADNVHITIAFLGNTDEARLPVLDRMLAEKCTGYGSFGFDLAGIGLFRNIRDPRIIWAGITDSKAIADLNALVAEGLKKNDFPLEERPFSPHLTLGRIKRITNIEKLKSYVEANSGTFIQNVQVKEVILFESVLKQTGPVYKPLGKYQL